MIATKLIAGNWQLVKNKVHCTQHSTLFSDNCHQYKMYIVYFGFLSGYSTIAERPLGLWSVHANGM